MFNLGLTLNNCELVYTQKQTNLKESLLLERLSSYINSQPDCENVWFDYEDKLFFSANQYRISGRIGNKQINDDKRWILYPKEQNFSSSKNDFLDSSVCQFGVPYVNFINQFLNEKIEFNFDDDIILSHKELKEKYNDSTVMIVGGGPSVNLAEWEDIDYDFLWSCNNFFKNEKFKNLEVDLAVFTPYIDLLDNNELIDYTENSKTLICFETERGDYEKDWTKMCDFINKYPERCVLYGTRYRSNLGVTARQIIYSIYLGAKKIYVVGFDGMNKKSSIHAFEGKKENVSWYKKYGNGFQNRQFVIYWEYIYKLKQKYGFEIYNLGDVYEGNVSKEITSTIRFHN